MFGSQLTPQEVGSVNGHVEAGSELFKLLRGIIEQRVQIEQEYGKKLEALVKKSKTDLQKLSEDHQLARDLDLDFVRQSDYSVIDREEPLVPPSVADHIPTVVQALGVWLKQMWDEAQNRRLLAADFKSEIADKAVLNSKFLDGLRDENIKCYRTMLSKRDAAYERKDKARGEYETIKGDLEKSKDKQLRAENEKKQSQYQRKAESQASQRDRMKNDYILSVRMANAVKHCTEGQAFPMIMDNMYNINRAQINNLQALMLNAARRQAELGQYLGTRLEEMMQCLGAVRAEHDIQAWINERISSGVSKKDSEPDFRVVLDQSRGEKDDLVIEGEERVMANMALECRVRLEPVQEDIEDLQRQIAQYKPELERLNADEDDDGAEWSEVVQNLDKANRELVVALFEEAKWKSRIDAIESTIGEVRVSNPHYFKKESFVLGTTCEVCDKTVRGEGLRCAGCNGRVHTACRLDIEPDCPGTAEKPKGFFSRTFKGRKKSHKRQTSNISMSSGNASKVSLENYTIRSPTVGAFVNAPIDSPIEPSVPPMLPTRTTGGLATNGRDGTTPQRISLASTMLAASRGGPPSLPNRTNSLDIPKASKSPAPVPSRASKPRSRSPSVASIYVVPVQKPGAVASLGIMPEEPRSEGGGAGKLMKVLADYSGEGEMYLTVRAGNKVMTVEDDDYNWPGWSYVEKDGRRGLVPSDYLELVPSSLSSAVPPPVSHPSNHTSAFQPTAKNMHKSARVLYDYSGDANEGVLTIRQGDIVKVVDPDVGPGWVEAMLNDTTGLIPESYIEYI